MGKTPKKAAAPGGDERNLYVRRLKATTAPSKASETSLPERQRESESSNRPKYSGIQKKIPPGPAKGFKSKLQSPGTLGSSHPPKRLGRPPGSTNKKKLLASVKSLQAQTSGMQPESEDTEVKSDALNRNENAKEENTGKSSNETAESATEKEDAANNSVPEETSPSDDRNGLVSGDQSEQVSEERPKNESETADGGNLEESLPKEIGESEECEGNGIKLALEAEENPACVLDKDQKEEQPVEETQACQTELLNGSTEKEEQNGSQTDTESCSVDIVESTTSEISETSECPSQNDTPKDKEQVDQKTNNDASFISYDSNIMLKDVKIKLNDCLKDNSKIFDTSNVDAASAPNTPMKDMSFGKTLRNISGRHSLSRMRHVTLREHRFSPNNSMYVNTSSASLQPDEATSDLKILHYRTGLDESLATNGSSPAERKRKLLDSEAWFSAKKQKTESENNSLLNTSLGLLKGMRKPVQVSTPNVHAQKYHSNNLDISGISDDGVATEQADGARKWCIIM